MKLPLLHLFLIYICMAVISTGCSSLPERNPLPESLSDQAVIPGIDGARYWADAPPPEIADWFQLSKEELKTRYPDTYGKAHNYLAISGGGQRGAFGAGLLRLDRNGYPA